MMFGIKTKKDKRIEHLENLLTAQMYKQPRIIEGKYNVKTIAGKIRIADGMPVELAKRDLVRNLIDDLLLNDMVGFEVKDDLVNHDGYILEAYLCVVPNNFK